MRLDNYLWFLLLLTTTITVEAADSDVDLNLSKEALKQVETSLLSMFGFKGRPKIDRSKIVIPQEMLEMYEIQMGHPLDTTSIPRKGVLTKSANTVRSFTHTESIRDGQYRGHHRFRLKFDVSAPKEEKLKAAEVVLRRIKLTEDDVPKRDRFQRIQVSDIVSPGRKGERLPILRVIDSKVVDSHENSSVSIDVLPAVQRWFEDPKGNHGVLITISGGSAKRHVRVRRDVHDDEEDWLRNQPVLYTYMDDGKEKKRTMEEMKTLRKKRSTKKGANKGRVSPCKRHKMYVNFTSVGWNDWIVAPPGYDAFFCQGACDFPLPDHLNATNHAIVQTIFNSMRPQNVPRACCVPTQLNAMSMLYLDDHNKVVLKNYKDMVVIGCGCR